MTNQKLCYQQMFGVCVSMLGFGSATSSQKSQSGLVSKLSVSAVGNFNLTFSNPIWSRPVTTPLKKPHQAICITSDAFFNLAAYQCTLEASFNQEPIFKQLDSMQTSKV